MKISVIDTSSVTEVRRLVEKPNQRNVYAALSSLVDQGFLVYPKQVLGELEEYKGSSTNNPDLPYEWAKRNEPEGTRFGFRPANLVEVLKHPVVRRVLDPEKSGKDEADAYVLELATHLRAEGHVVTVLTEDRNDKSTKLSLRSACGLLELPTFGIELLLERDGIWTRGSH